MNTDSVSHQVQLMSNEESEDPESVINNARVSICEIEGLLRDLDGFGKDLDKRKLAIIPLIEKIRPKLVRLEELKEIRGLLIRLQNAKSVHTRLEKLFKLKTTKTSEAESRILNQVELYSKLAIEYKSLENVKDDNSYKRYLKEIVIYWNKAIKEKAENIFETILVSINWPIVKTGVKLETDHPITAENLNRFKQFFKCLLALDLKPLFFDRESYQNIDSINLFDTSYICLPMDIMLDPLRKRFVYHFMRNTKTNQLSKPEWCLTQIMNWIKDHEDFLFEHVEPLIKDSKDNLLPAQIQFMCGLLSQTAQKFQCELPKLADDKRLFSHAFDETLQFERELIDTYHHWSNLFRENCNLLSLFALEPYFNRLINIERIRSMEYLESIISSETAWNPLISPFDDDDDDDDEDFKVPEVADNFILMLQTMTDRLSYLAKISHRYAFIDLKLKMLADFHLRLAQLYRSLEDEGVNDWPLSSKFFSILNAFNFVKLVLDNWKSHETFSEMSEFTQNESILDDTTETYQHIVNEMMRRIIASVLDSLHDLITSYSNMKWHILSPLDDTHQYVSYRLFYSVAKALELLKRKLSKNLFEEIIVTLARELNFIFMERVIIRNHFNMEGSKSLHKDLGVHLCAVFGAYIIKPETYFTEILEACRLLVLPRGNSLLLKDTLKHIDSTEGCNLGEFSIYTLTYKQVLEILSRKHYS